MKIKEVLNEDTKFKENLALLRLKDDIDNASEQFFNKIVNCYSYVENGFLYDWELRPENMKQPLSEEAKEKGICLIQKVLCHKMHKLKDKFILLGVLASDEKTDEEEEESEVERIEEKPEMKRIDIEITKEPSFFKY